MTKNITSPCSRPAWKRELFPETQASVPGIHPKGTHTEAEKKAMTLDFVEQTYPQEYRTHAYTDGPAQEAARNGSGGIYTSLNNGTTILIITDRTHTTSFPEKTK